MLFISQGAADYHLTGSKSFASPRFHGFAKSILQYLL